MLSLRVLGYMDKGGEWAAHCLETDLVGYGTTFEKALDNLVELTEMQISFSIFKKQPSLLDRPAPVDIIEIYNRMFRQALENYPTKLTVDKKRRVASIPLPEHPSRSEFCLVPA